MIHIHHLNINYPYSFFAIAISLMHAEEKLQKRKRCLPAACSKLHATIWRHNRCRSGNRCGCSASGASRLFFLRNERRQRQGGRSLAGTSAQLDRNPITMNRSCCLPPKSRRDALSQRNQWLMLYESATDGLKILAKRSL